MRILLRTFAVIVFAGLLGGALSGTASAAGIRVLTGVKGAGRISTPMTATRPELSCELQPPATDSTLQSCSGTEWTAPDSLTITAVPAPGWKFAGFDGCVGTVSGSACILTAGSTGVYTVLTARFTDVTPPAPVDGLWFTQSPFDEGVVDVSWSLSEDGGSSRCTIDGGASVGCSSPLRMKPPEGQHDVTVSAVDPSGNVSASRSVRFYVVDTKLTDGPAPGAEVRSATFTASSGFATDFECSLDGEAFIRCGHGLAKTPVAITLPALADGRHTLLVRGRYGAIYDTVPASRVFTIDTTAPQTLLQDTADGIELSATEPGATFRCRVDDAPFTDCASPYTLPDTAPGKHTLDAIAADRAGNADLTPARYRWTVAAPEQAAAPATPTVPAPVVVAVPAPAAAPLPPAPAFTLTYAFKHGRFTKLSANTQVTVTITRPHQRAKDTTLAALLNKKLANGTKITVRSGAMTKTLTIRNGKVV